jgi:putative flippase GtrA
MPASPAPEVSGNRDKRPLSIVVATFGGVGIAATLCYFLLATTLVALPGISPTTASVVAYILSAGFSYYGHRRLSFASKRSHAAAIPRFLTTLTVGLAIAFLLPKGGEALGYPPMAAFAAICVVIPATNFALLRLWVFDDGADYEASVVESYFSLFWALAALTVALIGASACALNAWRWGTVPDTSWLITVIEHIDAGERLYRDVIETNPPFSIWLYVFPVQFADLVGITPESAVRLYTILICLAGTSLTGWMLVCGGILKRRSAVIVSLVLFSITVLISGNSFTERDQIGAVLALPLFALAAWRIALPEARRPGPLHWLTAATGACVFAMVKPYYAIVVIAVAVYLALRRRDMRTLFLPEFVLSGAGTAGYLVLIYLLYPDFFAKLMPLLRDTYMAYRMPTEILLWLAMPGFVLIAAYAFCRRLTDRQDFPDVLMVASLAAWLPFFVQGKGWPYHAYPAILFGSAALVIGVAILFEKHASESRVGLVTVALAAILAGHLRFLPSERPADVLVAAALRPGEHPTVGMLGGGIETGHPFTRMIDGQWIEPYCSDWIAVYAVRRERQAVAAGDMVEAKRFEAMAAQYLSDKKVRLLRRLPQILIVDKRGQLVPEMLAKFGFAPILARYDRIASSGSVEIYRLVDRTSFAGPARHLPVSG